MNDPKVRVLAIIPSGFCYGLQHISIELFAQAQPQLETHFLITRWNNGDFEQLLRRRGFSYSFSWMGMFSRKLDSRNLKMSLQSLVKIPKLYLDFWRVCQEFRPQVVFFANHHELILLTPMLWLTRKKVICHMHDPSPPILFQRLSFAFYSRRVDLFIAISENVKKRLLQLGNVSFKTKVVHNGVSLPAYQYETREMILQNKFNWPEHAFIVGLTGQMTATKGHEDLLEAFYIAHHHNPNLRLVFGGKPLEPLYSLLENRVRERKLQQVVSFSGWLDNVETFFRNIDLFVLASRHDEGYGLVVAEAMAFGRPTIITASGGAMEVLEDRINGFIIAKNDVQDLAARILQFSRNPELCARFNKSAYLRIKEKFSIEEATHHFSNSILSTLTQ